MQFLRDILSLFYPNLCVTCSNYLLESELVSCINCRHDFPIIELLDFKNNKVATTFYGRIPIHNVVSFLYFKKEGKARKLIHQLKYKGRQDIGSFIGDWFGFWLKESNQMNDIDYIVPVPLHSKRLKERGYNQVETFGKSLSSILNIPYIESVLLRISASKTQTVKQRFERFNNNTTKFRLTDTTIFKSKHVLLVDDVITTGATIEACCNELFKTDNITISVATIAYTERR